ncbi:MAG: hypothetical protein JRN15_23850, partial [Nitrososphaerota archaeon]|nr:hypothetical protein [Nitrososphaerota archaeon]
DFIYAEHLVSTFEPIREIGPTWALEAWKQGLSCSDWIYARRFGLNSHENALLQVIESELDNVSEEDVEVVRRGLKRVHVNSRYPVSMYRNLTDDQIRRHNLLAFCSSNLRATKYWGNAESQLSKYEQNTPRLKKGTGLKPTSFMLKFDRSSHEVTFDGKGDLVCIAHNSKKPCKDKLTNFQATLFHPSRSGVLSMNERIVARFLRSYLSAVIEYDFNEQSDLWRDVTAEIARHPIVLSDFDKYKEFVGSRLPLLPVIIFVRNGISRPEAEKWASEGLDNVTYIVMAQKLKELAPDVSYARIANAMSIMYGALYRAMSGILQKNCDGLDTQKLVDNVLTCIEHGYDQEIEQAFVERGLAGVEALAGQSPEERTAVNKARPTYLLTNNYDLGNAIKELALPLNWWKDGNLDNNLIAEASVLRSQLRASMSEINELRAALTAEEAKQSELKVRLQEVEQHINPSTVEPSLS